MRLRPKGCGGYPLEVCSHGVRVRLYPDFWIGTDTAPNKEVHVAFACKERAPVDAFYAAAIAAGGRDNGKPGLRPEYHPTYYGAFVYDPDGNNVEACCHK